MAVLTARTALDSFLLARELEPGTIRFYRSQVSVFCSWYGSDDAPLDVETVNRFLLAKHEAGKSWPYRKSLRAALRALLNHAGIAGKLRTVKSLPLEPETWSAEEVRKLLEAFDGDDWMQTLIEAAYWTGLSQGDLFALERRHFAVGGVLKWQRKKTGQMVVVAIPHPLLEKLPKTGKCWPRRFSNEYFRRYFRRGAKRAGLRGTFKKLRKTSGTSVEELHPGCGHMHLGNTRRVFEIHYLSRRNLKPLSPAPLKAP